MLSYNNGIMKGVKSQPWTDQEDATLRQFYLTHTRQQIGEMIGRSEPSVRARCSTLRLNSKVQPWSDEEVAELVRHYKESPVVHLDVLVGKFNRLASNIARKAKKLGLTDKNRKRVERRKPTRMFESEEERKAHLCRLRRERFARGEHPRGMLGKKHSAETLRRVSEASKRQMALLTPDQLKARTDKASQTKLLRYGSGHPGIRKDSSFSRCKGGKRSDLGGMYFRSSWEANYARYLNFQKQSGEIIGWDYEVTTFAFHGVEDKVLSYTPDFRVTSLDGVVSYHEIKGWMTEKSKKQIDRFLLFYPEERFLLIGEKEYRGIEKQYSALIDGWEVSK